MLLRRAAAAVPRVLRQQTALPRTSTFACTLSLHRSVCRGVTSLSKTRDGKPIYCNEHDDDDQSRFTFSKGIAVPKVAAIIGGQHSGSWTEGQ